MLLLPHLKFQQSPARRNASTSGVRVVKGAAGERGGGL